MENIFLFNSLTVLRIYIFRKYGQTHLTVKNPFTSSFRGGGETGVSKVLPPVPCFISNIKLFLPFLSLPQFPASLVPYLLLFPPPFPLGSQPPVFPHLLILLVSKNSCHKYDNNIFHHLLPPSSCCLYIDLHSLQEPCMYIALHPGELNTRLHVVHLS